MPSAKSSFCPLAVLLLVLVPASPIRAEPQGAKPFASFFKDNCFRCHAGSNRRGGLDLERLGTELDNAEQFRRWVRIHDRVAAGEMPPRDEPWPDREAARGFLSQLSTSLTLADASQRRTPLRRLNRTEYENTVHDLFGIRVDLKDMLPKDPSAHGFDTIGEVLALSPEQIEVYLQAANKALDQVFGPDRPPNRVSVRMPLGRDPLPGRQIDRLFVKMEDDSLVTFQSHWCPTVFAKGQATADGVYRVRIKAKTYQTDKPVVMAVYGGDVIVGRAPSHLVGYYDVAPGEEWTVVTFEDYLQTHGCYQMKPYGLSAPTQGPKRFCQAVLR
jgi:hypothetical protein